MDLSVTGLADIARKAMLTDPDGRGVEAGVRAIIGALAEAGGDPEALGERLYEAARSWKMSPDEPDDVTREGYPPYAEADEMAHRFYTDMAQAVAACVVAHVREREVQPLQGLLKRAQSRLRSIDPETPMSEGQARRWYAKTDALIAEIDAALGGGGDA